MALLDGNVALVTGAARGQGRAHALTMARNGADVIAVDINENISTIPYDLATPEDLEETAAGVRALGRGVVALKADVRRHEGLDAAVERGLAEFGHIDILIANAGIWAVKPFWELTEEEWSDHLEVNLGGVWRAVKAVTPHMIERQSGAIVITGSSSSIDPGPDYAHYTAAKHGALGFMKSVALDLAPHGIRCNMICPGAVDTKISDWQGAYDMFAGKPHATREERNAAGHHASALKDTGLLDPQVQAGAALWLVSDGSAKVTGVAIPVDGGHLVLSRVNQSPVISGA